MSPVTPKTTRRSTCVQLAALVVMFLGGGLAGALLASLLTANAGLATIVGLFTFPLAFFAGMGLWLIVGEVVDLWRMALGRPSSGGANRVAVGSFVFLPTAVVKEHGYTGWTG